MALIRSSNQLMLFHCFGFNTNLNMFGKTSTTKPTSILDVVVSSSWNLAQLS